MNNSGIIWEDLNQKIKVGKETEQSYIMSEPKRKEKGKVPEPLSKDHIKMDITSKSINRVLTVDEYVDDQKAIKDKMWNLINKGLGETKTQTAAQKIADDQKQGKKFMQHVMQGQKDEFEM